VTRLAAHIWVGAYLARLRVYDIPAFVVAKGDTDAGAVLVKLNTLDGQAELFERRFDLMTGKRVWDSIHKGTETDIDAALQGQRASDPDLWIIEVEDRAGQHILDEDGLE